MPRGGEVHLGGGHQSAEGGGADSFRLKYLGVCIQSCASLKFIFEVVVVCQLDGEEELDPLDPRTPVVTGVDVEVWVGQESGHDLRIPGAAGTGRRGNYMEAI